MQSISIIVSSVISPLWQLAKQWFITRISTVFPHIIHFRPRSVKYRGVHMRFTQTHRIDTSVCFLLLFSLMQTHAQWETIVFLHCHMILWNDYPHLQSLLWKYALIAAYQAIYIKSNQTTGAVLNSTDLNITFDYEWSYLIKKSHLNINTYSAPEIIWCRKNFHLKIKYI